MRDEGELRVYGTPADVAAALADLVVECGRSAIDARGRFFLALSGGSTPKAAYALLAAAPRRDALAWERVQIYFGDERCVPPDDGQSNYRMAREAFLDTVGIPAVNVHRMRGEIDPADAAAAYREELLATLGSTPHFDLVLLGMGPDGHTASLFPGSDPTADDDALVRAVYSSSQQQWRITLTPRVINAARTVAFAVEGAAKSATLRAVRSGPYHPVQFPSQIVAPDGGRLLWLVDAAAAST